MKRIDLVNETHPFPWKYQERPERVVDATNRCVVVPFQLNSMSETMIQFLVEAANRAWALEQRRCPVCGQFTQLWEVEAYGVCYRCS